LYFTEFGVWLLFIFFVPRIGFLSIPAFFAAATGAREEKKLARGLSCSAQQGRGQHRAPWGFSVFLVVHFWLHGFIFGALRHGFAF